MLKNLMSGAGLPVTFSDLLRVRALHLIAIDAPARLVDERALVALGLGVVTARLEVVLHPVQRRRPADEHEAIRREMEQDRVADHVAIVVAGDELLRRVDAKVVERIDAESGDQLQRIGTFEIQVRHVVGLVEQCAGLAPRALLVAPVRELVRHHREGVRADLRVAQHLDWALRSAQCLF
jgi:hypothetical protein